MWEASAGALGRIVGHTDEVLRWPRRRLFHEWGIIQARWTTLGSKGAV